MSVSEGGPRVRDAAEALRRRLTAAVEAACCPDAEEALIGARRLELLVDDVLLHAVRQARRRGYPWARIGRLLGRSRQAMRQRFGALVPEPAPKVTARELVAQHRAYVHVTQAERVRRADATPDAGGTTGGGAGGDG